MSNYLCYIGLGRWERSAPGPRLVPEMRICTTYGHIIVSVSYIKYCWVICHVCSSTLQPLMPAYKGLGGKEMYNPSSDSMVWTQKNKKQKQKIIENTKDSKQEKRKNLWARHIGHQIFVEVLLKNGILHSFMLLRLCSGKNHTLRTRCDKKQ